MKHVVIIASLALFASLSAQAQTDTPRFDQRQVNQQQRIEQGVASGQLTQREATRLDNGQARLQSKEDRAKADGVVTPQERARLQHAENEQSRRIYREKHDRQHDLNHDGKKDRPARRN